MSTESEFYNFLYGNLYQFFLNQVKILPVFIHLVESGISAGGFLQNVNISIKENTGNTFITVFWLFFLFSGGVRKGEPNQKAMMGLLGTCCS